MKLASINLNKRLGNPKSKSKFEKWLDINQIDLIIVQEPWARNKNINIEFRKFKDLGGTDSVRIWLKRNLVEPKVEQILENFQVIKLDYINIINVYLSAYSSTDRINFLNTLSNYLLSLNDEPICVLGDFNLAPFEEDGLIDDRISTFNSPQERESLKVLLNKNKLNDFLKPHADNVVESEFTIIRKNKNYTSKFRCDLLLTTNYLNYYISAKYDHSTRSGSHSFTDHSAIVWEIPVTLPIGKYQQVDLFDDLYTQEEKNKLKYHPHKTAMPRTEPSSIAKLIVDQKLIDRKTKSILDYGCGRGKDLEFYKKLDYQADGWDPHPGYEFTTLPTKEYDFVTCVFVLNVIPNPYERLTAIKKALSFTRKGGKLIIATRSPDTIENEATTKNWIKHNDGYWSSETRHTFQKGIGLDEINNLLLVFNEKIDNITNQLPKINDTVLAVVIKKN